MYTFGEPMPVVIIDLATGEALGAGDFGGGGGGTSSLAAQANAAYQVSIEGSTDDPLSMNLNRELRVIDTQVLAELVDVNAALTDTTPTDVIGPVKVTTKVLSVDTAAYAVGDIIADTEAISAAFRMDDKGGVLTTLTLYDFSDGTACALRVVFLTASTSLGSENAAPSLSDANGLTVPFWVDIPATGWVDWGGYKAYCLTGLTIPVQPIAGTDDLAVAVVSPSTASAAPDYVASTDLGIAVGIV